MQWTRIKSASEQLMVEILSESNQPLSMGEIALEMIKRNPKSLNGKTPRNSLYSIIYRRENRRIELGLDTLFKASKKGRILYYSLNTNDIKYAGEKITKQ